MKKEAIYIELYKENRTHGRHHEAQRTTMSQLIIAITAGISAVISIDKALTMIDLPLTVFISILGVFSMLFSVKYGSRQAYHWQISRFLLSRLSQDLLDDLNQDRRFAKANSRYPQFVTRNSITKFWLLLHGIIMLYGLVLSSIILVS